MASSHTTIYRRWIAGAAATAVITALALTGTTPNADTAAHASDAPPPVTLRGYLRDRNGHFTTIDVPGAIATKVGEVNNRGEIVGAYSDGAAVHAFLRDRRGRYTTIDPPGAAGVDIGTNDINDRGQIAGYYLDAGGTYRGFLRSRKGSFTTIDHPEAAGTSPYGSGTVVYGIDNRGDMVGAYATGGTLHGFVRDRKGVFTTVDYPGALETALDEINERGQIVGSYGDSPGSGLPSSFLLQTGDYTPIAYPAASQTYVDDVNNRRQIVGYYLDDMGHAHGYLRSRQGHYTQIDHPDAAPLGTDTGGINDRGEIVGAYYDYVSSERAAGAARLTSPVSE
jgi:uncharacterized membrane protein